MKITIITAVKNGMPYLKDAVKSFELQDYKKKELIIVYSKSNDGTDNYLVSLKKKYKIFLDKNTGNKFDAINIGIKKSSGDVIGLLHADDIFFNYKTLTNIADKIRKNKLDGAYGGVYFSKKNNLKIINRIWEAETFERKKLYYGWMPPHTSLFLKKNIFTKIGHYSNKFRISSDYEFILRLFFDDNYKISSTNLVHTIMRDGGDSRKIKLLLLKLIEDITILNKYQLSVFIVIVKILSKFNQFFKNKKINNKYLNEFNENYEK
jgi:glycosyltransferase involved in cell wall biosynthesis